MVWYMNFCAPFMPNDPTINTHRTIQTTLLLIYSLIYAAIHIYYKFWGPLPLASEKETSQQFQNKQNDQNFSEMEGSQQKEVSIKLEEMPNDSCVQLKKTNNTWEQSTVKHESVDKIKQNVTLSEIEGYFPIVYGHFSVATGLSIMYTPYAEQSIACLLYVVLTLMALGFNSRRWHKSTIAVWIVMVLLLLFLLNCILLQVGQSNWDVIHSTCFSKQYVPLYS